MRFYQCPDLAADNLDVSLETNGQGSCVAVHFFSYATGCTVPSNPFQESVQVDYTPVGLPTPLYASIVPNESANSPDLFEVQWTTRDNIRECLASSLHLSSAHNKSTMLTPYLLQLQTNMRRVSSTYGENPLRLAH